MTASQRIAEDAARPALSAELLHGVRTPLNQIIGYAELLVEQEENGPAELLQDLRRIRDAGQEALRVLSGDTPVNLGKQVVATASNLVPLLDPPRQIEADVSNALILVVDDSEMNRDVLSRRLKHQGHFAVLASNGAEALSAVRAQSFDLVLLDIMMPEIDGFEVLRQMKSDPNLSDIPVIMISALDDLSSVVRCIEMGAEDYLTKPFEATLLKARVGSCLEKKINHDREMRLFTQCERDNSRLKELERQRADLTRMIVHDLRTPLTSVIAGMQTLESMGGLEPDQTEILTISSEGAGTLLEMINSLLDVEQMESGSMRIECSMISPHEIVSSAVSQIGQLADSSGLKLTILPDPDLPKFWGDESKLRRVLVNLIGNALKFTPSGGTVTVRAQRRDDPPSTSFSVTDTGEGIPADAFGRIFEKFGQVETRKAGRKMSSGLGLTFCKLVAEAHGGEMQVESVLGEGSTFSLVLPTDAGEAICGEPGLTSGRDHSLAFKNKD